MVVFIIIRFRRLQRYIKNVNLDIYHIIHSKNVGNKSSLKTQKWHFSRIFFRWHYGKVLDAKVIQTIAKKKISSRMRSMLEISSENVVVKNDVNNAWNSRNNKWQKRCMTCYYFCHLSLDLFVFFKRNSFSLSGWVIYLVRNSSTIETLSIAEALPSYLFLFFAIFH